MVWAVPKVVRVMTCPSPHKYVCYEYSPAACLACMPMTHPARVAGGHHATCRQVIISIIVIISNNRRSIKQLLQVIISLVPLWDQTAFHATTVDVSCT